MAALSGCGEELAELTPEEEAAVISYSAHVISKYNKRQTDGIIRVPNQLLEEAEAAVQEPEQPEPMPEEFAEEPVEETSEEPAEESGETDSAPIDTTPIDTSTPEVDLGQFVHLADGLTAAWTYTEVSDHYVDSNAMSITAGRNKVYVILTIDIKNNTGSAIPCDVLQYGPVFHLWTNGKGKTPNAVTILLNDFSTFQGTVPAGQTVSTKLFFQKSLSGVSPEDSYELDVTLDGSTGRVGKAG